MLYVRLCAKCFIYRISGNLKSDSVRPVLLFSRQGNGNGLRGQELTLYSCSVRELGMEPQLNDSRTQLSGLSISQ